HDEKFSAFSRVLRAISQFAGQAKLTNGCLTIDFFFFAAPKSLFSTFNHPIEELGGFCRICSKIEVKRVAKGIFNDTLRFNGRKLILCLSNEFRLADEDREHANG